MEPIHNNRDKRLGYFNLVNEDIFHKFANTNRESLLIFLSLNNLESDRFSLIRDEEVSWNEKTNAKHL